MKIKLFEPPQPVDPDAEPDPGFLPETDIESARRWAARVLQGGEDVVMTEKVDGRCGRFAWYRGRMWRASRTQFYPPGLGPWQDIAADLEERLRSTPGFAVYGEVYGPETRGMHYGRREALAFAAFDVLAIDSRRWLDYDEFVEVTERLGLLRAPVLYRGPWPPHKDGVDASAALAEGPSPLASASGATHVREGWVLRPVKERTDPNLGRVILKLHGEGYLLRKDA
jgi:RNA ligase (TIGR02306 family)